MCHPTMTSHSDNITITNNQFSGISLQDIDYIIYRKLNILRSLSVLTIKTAEQILYFVQKIKIFNFQDV